MNPETLLTLSFAVALHAENLAVQAKSDPRVSRSRSAPGNSRLKLQQADGIVPVRIAG